MERILVIGSGGSGKTTVARTIAERLGLPLIHLDAIYWRPGWTPTPSEEWGRLVTELVARPRWVMDGNYGGTLDVRLAACDTVVFLDLPTRVCLWRVLKRSVQYRGRTRPDVAPGCPEKLGWEFFAWVLTYRSRRRPRILERLRRLVGQRAVVLSSQGDVDRFIASLAVPTNVHSP
jgi:adenylate kinase family enzyme